MVIMMSMWVCWYIDETMTKNTETECHSNIPLQLHFGYLCDAKKSGNDTLLGLRGDHKGVKLSIQNLIEALLAVITHHQTAHSTGDEGHGWR
jgi:hypothetical protein